MTATTFAPPAGSTLPALSLAQVRSAIDSQAAAYGVPTSLAEAIAYHESGMNPYAVGDSGTSFGEYQLHIGGELGNLPGTQSQQITEAYDPGTNAGVALREVAAVLKSNPGADPGQVAAAAQRPANRSAYAAAIDQLLNGGVPTPTSTSSSGGLGATNAAFFPGGSWDPLNWPGQILDSGVSSVWDQVQPFLVTGMFAVGAIALFVIGAKQLVQPTIDKAQQHVSEATKEASSAVGAAGMLA